MHARVTVFAAPPQASAYVEKLFRSSSAPFDEMDGHLGAYLARERPGRWLLVTLWASAVALRDSDRAAEQIRRELVAQAGGRLIGLREYEVVATNEIGDDLIQRLRETIAG